MLAGGSEPPLPKRHGKPCPYDRSTLKKWVAQEMHGS
jgi:hypothetical protein